MARLETHGSSEVGIRLHARTQVEKNGLTKLISVATSDGGFIPLSYIQKIPTTTDKIVDLEIFAATSLGEQMRYYAPHLFSHDNKAKPLPSLVYAYEEELDAWDVDDAIEDKGKRE